MRRRAALLALVAALARPAPGEETVEEILRDATRILQEDAPADARGDLHDRAIARAYDAARLDPNAYEAFLVAAVARLQFVFDAPDRAQEVLLRLRAQGRPTEELQEIAAEASAQLQDLIEASHRDFALMEQALLRSGRQERDLLLFAGALMKFAGREYEKTKHGQPGAVADLKTLVQRRYRVELCANFLARCYLLMGVAEYQAEEYDKAQERWSEALRWAQDPRLRRLVRNNQAGAYQADNAYDNAETVLRKLVAEEPDRPEHWKSLGLILGFQGRLKEALLAYGEAREACARRAGVEFLAVLHGNAWLRAAVIHANLLPEDGDPLEAWRLLLEYRAVFGYDYAFSLALGEIALEHEQFELAARAFEHARTLLPFCPQAYQRLVELAPRLPGTPEERRARVEKAREAFEANRARFNAREEAVDLVRVCGGTRDIGDGRLYPGLVPPPDPDPLAGLGADRPPEWLVAVARSRKPFVPAASLGEGPGERAAAPAPEGGEGAGGGTRFPWLPVAGGAGALALLAACLRLRRRPARDAV